MALPLFFIHEAKIKGNMRACFVHYICMRKYKRYLIIFTVGAAGYGTIELLWRGRTHWSMLIAGGVCFILFTAIGRRMKSQPLLYKCVLGSMAVTVVELVFGCVFNLWLKQGVWDYSNLPLNVGGQICLLYSVLWGILSAVFVPFAQRFEQYLQNKKSVVR